ncbi:DNA replication terminus site-binding protein [Pseudomonas silesiensis]|uniref:DNA replication terminus site-binding protein n=1 Tax=Pseudomonas silesiensis TaxID=1853130 RepID=UPI0030DD2BEF
MSDAVKAAYQELLSSLAIFDATWPSLVCAGHVWQLPLLNTQKTPSYIPVKHLTGLSAVNASRAAFSEFERDIGQAPGTVMRLPGYFILSSSVLEQGRAVNRCKAALQAAIEAERVAQNVSISRRSHIMRRALGKDFSLNQLKRCIQVFDATPRQITFTWAGHTSGKEKVGVGAVREYLLAEAQGRAQREGVAIEQTPEWMDLRALSNLSDDDVLDHPKQVAPHPRSMLWFSGSSRYDAMVHANLPIFVLQGNAEPKVVGLKDFDSQVRTAKRPDQKNRRAALPGGRFFLPSDEPKTPPAEEGAHLAGIESTYGQS